MAQLSHATFPPNDAGQELHDWFDEVLRLVDQTVVGVVEDGPHREAMVLNLLTKNARHLRESEVDRHGRLYTPLCFMLAAACRHLRLKLGPGHWAAAVANVISLTDQVHRARSKSTAFGLELGSPARLLKEQMDEALRHAGVAGVPTFVDREGRRIALGLGINWGLRFLCAYALECEGLEIAPGRRDLAWIAGRLRPRVDSSTAAATNG